MGSGPASIGGLSHFAGGQAQLRVTGSIWEVALSAGAAGTIIGPHPSGGQHREGSFLYSTGNMIVHLS